MKQISRFPTIILIQLTVYLVYNVMAIIKLSAEDDTEIKPLITQEEKVVPYQAGIIYEGHFKCGAVLVHHGSTQFILTAARCVGFGDPPTSIPVEKNLIQVFAETRNALHIKAVTQVRGVNKIVIHPCFNKGSGSYPNNIAIIFMKDNFDVSEDGAKACDLPPNKGYKIPKYVTVSGYGNQVLGEDGDGELRKLEMPTQNWDLCRNSRPAEKQFCAGFLKEGGKGICEGDEGGPAMGYDANGGINFYLAGIISHIPHWAKQCGDGHTLSLFTDVSLYLDWIKVELFKRLKPMENKTCEI